MTDGREAVQAQYESWVYPLPIPDLAEAITDGKYDAADPAFVRRKVWPRRIEPGQLEILIGGCGTNQAAFLAFTNPECRVVGVDLSESSLGHQQYLKEKHNLDNLELRQLPVEQVGDLGQSFDLVVSTGVLHHLPDPDAGVRALRDVLAPHGAMILMLYGAYGRLGLYMVQDVLRLLGATQDAAGLALVKDVIDSLPPWHPVQRYLEVSTDAQFDAGLMTNFVPPIDRAYTVPQVLQFARDNGLQFQGWLDALWYSVSARVPEEDDMLRVRAESLDDVERWHLVELVWQAIGAHQFVVCHVDRPESDYVLDFSGDAWLEYVPSLRAPIELVVSQMMTSGSIDGEPAEASIAIQRNGHKVQLDHFGAAALQLLDGKRSIREILDETSQLDGPGSSDASEQVRIARRFFEEMAEWDHFLFEIP